ncbi:GDSL-type esterase/lipase family protein [Acrocarpospora sp. B8E8]|uniref:GDSL-type esterase/lipase family protein n=1 Tax=Acrocarpospora sp. B8E8 TaxID=3153572 RepID=UPI00325D61FC
MIKKITPVLVVALCWPITGTAAARAEPVVLAALGDSISVGFNACGWYAACPSRSWAAGDHPEVNSHYLRMLAAGADVRGRNLNFAVSGSTSADLLGQARAAVAAKATYVTILIGANDACVRTEKQMTPVAAYRQRVAAALRELRPTGARVFLASVPDLKHLWRVGKDNPLARTFWSIGKICQALLANPGSAAKKDAERRDRVRARVVAYNSELEAACAEYGPGCRYDGGQVFAYPFTLDQVSGWDFFHPNVAGQRALAEITFREMADQLKV